MEKGRLPLRAPTSLRVAYQPRNAASGLVIVVVVIVVAMIVVVVSRGGSGFGRGRSCRGTFATATERRNAQEQAGHQDVQAT